MTNETAPQDAPQNPTTSVLFSDLALSPAVMQALQAVGYETPSPIQAATIPPLLDGRDVLGQAQTGTGKTAAFALPTLSRIDLHERGVQALVLAPTRELAIQVAEAFQRYAAQMPGFHVLPIYGGQSYQPQLMSLKRGAHVVVGTPGRVMDHMERGTLKLDKLKTLVLDEADEMLRMGFIDDVEWILQRTPEQRQVALFSATMPSAVRRIAQTYLRNPAEITIKSKTATATNINQRYWLVSGTHKLDALTRMLEAEPFDGMIIFARTKQATVELAEKLEARGYAAAALNGDMEQKARERTVAKLKDGQLDIVVATDVAARGLDVERISHVINYDVPTDPESYVHRIGRTGRAGRSGEAILFISPRERNLLRMIERVTRKHISPMELPTAEAVNEQRVSRFKTRIRDALGQQDIQEFRELIESCEQEFNVPAVEIAAALVHLLQGDQPLKLPTKARASVRVTETLPPPAPGMAPTAAPAAPTMRTSAPKPAPFASPAAFAPTPEPAAAREPLPQAVPVVPPTPPPPPKLPFLGADAKSRAPDRGPPPPRVKLADQDEGPVEFERFRIEVGKVHGVQPGNIVGAIANEADLDSKHIGRVDIRENHSYIELPVGMPRPIFRALQKVWVVGQQLRISRAEDGIEDEAPRRAGPPRREFGGAPGSKPAGKFGSKPLHRSAGSPPGRFASEGSQGHAPRSADARPDSRPTTRPVSFKPPSDRPAGGGFKPKPSGGGFKAGGGGFKPKPGSGGFKPGGGFKPKPKG